MSGVALFANGGVENSPGKPHGDAIPQGHLIRRTQDFSGSIVRDGVAPFEQFERAALVELQLQLLVPMSFRDERTVDRGAERFCLLLDSPPQQLRARP